MKKEKNKNKLLRSGFNKNQLQLSEINNVYKCDDCKKNLSITEVIKYYDRFGTLYILCKNCYEEFKKIDDSPYFWRRI